MQTNAAAHSGASVNLTANAAVISPAVPVIALTVLQRHTAPDAIKSLENRKLPVTPSDVRDSVVWLIENDLADVARQVLKANSDIGNRALNLDGVRLPDNMCAWVVDVLKDQSIHITELSLCGCGLDNNHADAIARLLSPESRLMAIKLSGNRLGDEAVDKIAQALKKNTVLISLDVSSNALGFDGAFRILRTVCISKNFVGKERMPKNTTLRELDISGHKRLFYATCLKAQHRGTGFEDSIQWNRMYEAREIAQKTYSGRCKSLDSLGAAPGLRKINFRNTGLAIHCKFVLNLFKAPDCRLDDVDLSSNYVCKAHVLAIGELRKAVAGSGCYLENFNLDNQKSLRPWGEEKILAERKKEYERRVKDSASQFYRLGQANVGRFAATLRDAPLSKGAAARIQKDYTSSMVPLVSFKTQDNRLAKEMTGYTSIIKAWLAPEGNAVVTERYRRFAMSCVKANLGGMDNSCDWAVHFHGTVRNWSQALQLKAAIAVGQLNKATAPILEQWKTEQEEKLFSEGVATLLTQKDVEKLAGVLAKNRYGQRRLKIDNVKWSTDTYRVLQQALVKAGKSAGFTEIHCGGGVVFSRSAFLARDAKTTRTDFQLRRLEAAMAQNPIDTKAISKSLRYLVQRSRERLNAVIASSRHMGEIARMLEAILSVGEEHAPLIKKLARAGFPSFDGKTPLHIAASNRCHRLAALLCEAGADPMARSNDGLKLTPLEIARRSGSAEIVALLEKHIASMTSDARTTTDAGSDSEGEDSDSLV